MSSDVDAAFSVAGDLYYVEEEFGTRGEVQQFDVVGFSYEFVPVERHRSEKKWVPLVLTDYGTVRRSTGRIKKRWPK